MKTTRLTALFAITAAPIMLFASSAADVQIESTAKASYNLRVVLENRVTAPATNGVVVLTGAVPDVGQKALAEGTVGLLPGVTRVDNQIKVDSAASELSDEGLALKIHNLLLLRGAINATAIKVKVDKGVVALSGAADTMRQRSLAEDDLTNIEGVKAVSNELTVGDPTANSRATGEAIDDASIAAQLKYVLLSYRPTHAVKTVITVTNGAVRIAGDASSGYEKDMVAHFTEGVRGVKSYANDITVHDN